MDGSVWAASGPHSQRLQKMRGLHLGMIHAHARAESRAILCITEADSIARTYLDDKDFRVSNPAVLFSGSSCCIYVGEVDLLPET